jgi:ATP-binding protein involved in chromosome partitioning
MNAFDQQKEIPGVKNIIAVGSGKGGVGKSTVSSNLATLLSLKGYKVGLLDADIYGPSVPSLFGCHQQDIELENEKMIPLERYGVKLMSMGFLIEEDQPVIWRGPMLFKAIDQFLNDVHWGELDYLIVDLPPGTGDVALTLAQKTVLSKAIVVTTPQSLSLAEVKKALMMFKKMDVPIAAIVQNMSGFTLPNGESLNLFPEGNFEELLENYDIKNFVKIPFEPSVGKTAEAGIPYVKSSKDSETFKAVEKLSALIL